MRRRQWCQAEEMLIHRGTESAARTWRRSLARASADRWRLLSSWLLNAVGGLGLGVSCTPAPSPRVAIGAAVVHARRRPANCTVFSHAYYDVWWAGGRRRCRPDRRHDLAVRAPSAPRNYLYASLHGLDRIGDGKSIRYAVCFVCQSFTNIIMRQRRRIMSSMLLSLSNSAL